MLSTKSIVAVACLAISCRAAGVSNPWPVQSFETAPFTPPVLDITQFNTSCEYPARHDEYIFIAPDGSPLATRDVAPQIFTATGDLVWNAAPQHAFNFGVQTYKGQPVLVGWNGSLFPEPLGRGNGVIHVWDQHYEPVATVKLPGNFLESVAGAHFPSNIDLHELYITEDDVLLVTANNVTQTDLSSVGGPTDGWVVEAQFYALDIATSEVLFSWKSLDHLDAIPLKASTYPLGSEGYNGRSQDLAWGYFHINAVSSFNGGYLVSSRYLCSVIAITANGEIDWIVQGRPNWYFTDFELGPGVDFCYQHDARVVHDHSHHRRADVEHSKSDNAVILQMHDNHNCPIDNSTVPTSGKILRVDLSTRQVTLLQQFSNPSEPIYSTAQGSVQRLGRPDGRVFIGHGFVPILQEFSSTGEPLSRIQFGLTAPLANGRPGVISTPLIDVTLSYRAFKQAWVGCPRGVPAVVARTTTQGGTEVFVSWNGATEVEAWEIEGGNQTLRHLVTARRTSFETKVELPVVVERVQVRPVLRRNAPRDCGQGTMSGMVTVQKTS